MPELIEGIPSKAFLRKAKYVTWKWYVYILQCQDNSYYTGITWQPGTRWAQHLSGLGAKYTAKHKPDKVMYIEEYENLDAARRREKQIKGWTRAKKEKLISSEWGKW